MNLDVGKSTIGEAALRACGNCRGTSCKNGAHFKWPGVVLSSLALLLSAMPLGAQKPILITTVPLGTAPSAIAVNPNTNRIYVASRDGNNVTVIDGATNIPIVNLAVKAGPEAVAVNTITNRIYVADAGDGAVTVINGDTNKIITSLTTGISPAALAINEITNKIYVANRGNDFITEVDGATNIPISIPTAVGAKPFAIAVNPITNKIYVTEDDNTVTVLDGTTRSTTSVSVGRGVHAVAVNQKTNQIWVTNSADLSVTKIDGDTNLTVSVEVGVPADTIAVNQTTNTIYAGGAVGSGGGIFLSDAFAVINGASLSFRFLGMKAVHGIAVDEVLDKAYVANSFVTPLEGDITVINATGSAVALPLGGNLVAVAANPKTSRAYVANNSGRSVAVIGWPIDFSSFVVSPAVALGASEIASLCATSLKRSTASVFMGLRRAGGFNLLASKQVTLAPGAGDCLNFSWPPQFDQNPQFDRNIVAFVVLQGSLNDQREIVQNRADSDGDIAASLQIQFGPQSTIPGQTFLYVPLQEHCNSSRRRDRQ